jgi:hypothetical protein
MPRSGRMRVLPEVWQQGAPGIGKVPRRELNQVPAVKKRCQSSGKRTDLRIELMLR